MKVALLLGVMYGVLCGFASWGIAGLWGLDAQLIFLPFAFMGGLLVGRLVA